jgi:UDPglucose 6-dehydrogenase
MKILIVGHGFVGKAVDYGFQHPDIQKTIVDPIYGNSLDNVDLTQYTAAFVAVPTPMGADGSINYSILREVVDKLTTSKVITIIKSTVTPDFFDFIESTNIVYNPEFLTEKSAKEDFVNPPFHILGGNDMHTHFVEKLYENYSLCNPCPVFKVSVKEASLIKYAINNFLAMKVTFFNQLYDLTQKEGVNFNKIIRAVGSDPRIGHSHTKVPGPDGKQGYGGACFPKDTAALFNFDNMFTIIGECIKINNAYRSQYELDDREREQNVNYGQA